MNQITKWLRFFRENPCVSGKNTAYRKDELLSVSPVFQNSTIDSVGNIVIEMKSKNPNAKTLLIEAHRDVIGLCIKSITEDGFLVACTCGGFDLSILPGTEFIILGKEKIPAIATSIPPHLKDKNKKQNQSEKSKELYLDAGFKTKKEAESFLSIGDVAVFDSEITPLLSNQIVGAGLDNSASVAALILAAEKLSEKDLPANLYFSFTVGEETSSNGVRALCEKISPDAALVVDVGFAYTQGNDPAACISMHSGPSLSFTDTLSREMTLWVKKCAEEENFPLQFICEAGGTGTSATALNLQNGGIPSAVLSIPLKNMHTPSEIVSIDDIKKTAELLSILTQKPNFFSQEAFFESI